MAIVVVLSFSQNVQMFCILREVFLTLKLKLALYIIYISLWTIYAMHFMLYLILEIIAINWWDWQLYSRNQYVSLILWIITHVYIWGISVSSVWIIYVHPNISVSKYFLEISHKIMHSYLKQNTLNHCVHNFILYDFGTVRSGVYLLLSR